MDCEGFKMCIISTIRSKMRNTAQRSTYSASPSTSHVHWARRFIEWNICLIAVVTSTETGIYCGVPQRCRMQDLKMFLDDSIPTTVSGSTN